MSWLEALVLGLVGGVTDFFPVGASAHRILAGRVLFGSGYDRGFAGCCELAAAVAAAVALRREARDLLRPASRGTAGVLVLILAAAVPAAVFSLPFRDAAATLDDNLAAIGVLLLVSGLLLYVAEEIGRRTRPLEELGMPGALLVGLLQVLAVLPGVSRPGAAISGAMLAGITREAATTFALLVSIPMLVFSGAWDITASAGASGATGRDLALGTSAAFAAGFVAVGFLRWAMREFSLMVFAYYLWLLGILTIFYGVVV